MSDSLKIGLIGATGRMGRAVAALLADSPDLRLAAGLVRGDSDWLGRQTDADPELAYSDRLEDVVAAGDVIIDFSQPELAVRTAEACAAAGRPFVTGTTGLGTGEKEALRSAAGRIAVVAAPNMSVGVTLALALTELAAAALNSDYDAEVFEAHHRHKKDAPSGTALALGRAIASGRGQDFETVRVLDRTAASGERRAGDIGFSVLRGGEIVGEHTVSFCGAGDRLEISHRAADRSIFARGALQAARWAANRPAGLYDMRDVLGLGNLRGHPAPG